MKSQPQNPEVRINPENFTNAHLYHKSLIENKQAVLVHEYPVASVQYLIIVTTLAYEHSIDTVLMIDDEIAVR